MPSHGLIPRIALGVFTRPGRPLVEVLQNDPVKYVEIAEQNWVTACVAVAATMAVIWDWITSLDAEVEHVWKRRSTLSGKPLYLFLRYGGMAFQLYDGVTHLRGWNASFCTIFYYVDPIGTAILLAVVDLILGYRVLCLYRMKRSLVFFNVFFFIVSALCFVTITGLAYQGLTGIDTPQGMTGCFCLIGSWLVFMSSLPGLLFELWIFGLALYRVAVFAKATRRGLPSIVRLLLKDTISWFFVISAVITWNMVSLVHSPTGSHTIAVAPFHAAIIICGCRLIIRMRKGAIEETGSFETLNDSGVAHTQNSLSDMPHDLPDHDAFDVGKMKWIESSGGSTVVYSSPASGARPKALAPIQPHREPRTFDLRCEIPDSPTSSDMLAARRFVGIAQKLGLPPALSSDFHTLWHESHSSLELEGGVRPKTGTVRLHRINLSRRNSANQLSDAFPSRDGSLRSSAKPPPEYASGEPERYTRTRRLTLPDEEEDIIFSKSLPEPYTPIDSGDPHNPFDA